MPAPPNPESPRAAPPLSVVMPVHNAVPYLDAAVESILGQTLRDFEFVILDDASTDGSARRLTEWAERDPRIRLITSKEKLGPARSSDRVARAAAAPVVARMDADDISHPERLEQQFNLLCGHPDVGLVASLFEVVDVHGRLIREAELWRFTRRTDAAPFAHGATMYRQSVFLAAGGYRPQCDFWEDKDLFIRMAQLSKVMIIPRALYQVRQCPVSTRVSSKQTRVENAFDLMFRSLERLSRGEGYEDLIQKKHDSIRKVDPRALLVVGSIALWAGQRPRLVTRLFKRARLSLNRSSVSAIAWALWAQASPSTLRRFLLLLRAGRSARAAPAAGDDKPFLWHPPWQPANPAGERAAPDPE